MKNFALFLFTLTTLSSCGQKLNNQQAEEAIMNYYIEASLAAGGGTYSISTVEISLSEKQNDETWLVKARVTGSHQNLALPENQGPFPVDNENTYTLQKEDKLWKVISIK